MNAALFCLCLFMPLGQSGEKTEAKSHARFRYPEIVSRYFWSDICVCNGFRIRASATEPLCRLCDNRNEDLLTGTESECRAQLKKIIEDKKIVASEKPTVLLLHGALRGSESMESLANSLRNAGFNAYPLGYASNHQTVEVSADCLRKVIAGIEGPRELYLVGHSMGGLVIRAYFEKNPDPRIKRAVMLGTPNQGAERADALNENVFFQTIFGPAGNDLRSGPNGLVARLKPTLPIEFGLLAGGKSDGKGYSITLAGDDDGTVTVESVRLAGARDFRIVKCSHTSLPSNSEVQASVVKFFQKGYFTTEAKRSPIAIPKETSKGTRERSDENSAKSNAKTATKKH